MNKSASVLLKILLVIGIIIVILLIVAGITIYQASGVIVVVKEESAKIETSSRLLAEQKDCARLTEIEESMYKIEAKFGGACNNPILNMVVKGMKNVPIKCDTLPELKADFEKQFSKAKLYCDSYGKINESAINSSMTREELMALAQKYGIEI